jgi:chemotaxis methyl-accepting protein methylase
MDSLLRLGLAERLGLHVVAADINPRVVAWINRTRGTVPLLGLVSGVDESDRIRLTDDYRAYFSALGASIGEARVLSVRNRLAKSVAVGAGVSDAIDAVTLDIVSERLEERFDLVVVTNVFPYLTDADLLLALTNIVSMLAPGGVLLHNEPRPMLADASLALNLPLVHSRSAVIATVEGTRSPLYDAVWMHRAADRKEPR